MITLDKFLAEAKRTIAQDKDVATKKKAAPKKYHEKLGKGTKQARAKHFEEHGKKADNDPSAYGPAPGDEKANTKEGKWTKKYKEKYGSKNEEFVSAAFEDIDFLDAQDLLYEDVDTALAKKAKETGYPKGLLRQIYNRGSAAFKGGHRPGQNQHSWSFARVNSVIAGGPARKSDKDIWAKMQAAKKKKKKPTKKK